MNDALEQNLNLPKIGGTINVFFVEDDAKINLLRNFCWTAVKFNEQKKLILDCDQQIKNTQNEFLRTHPIRRLEESYLEINSYKYELKSKELQKKLSEVFSDKFYELKLKELQNNLDEVFSGKFSDIRKIIEKESYFYFSNYIPLLQKVFQEDHKRYSHHSNLYLLRDYYFYDNKINERKKLSLEREQKILENNRQISENNRQVLVLQQQLRLNGEKKIIGSKIEGIKIGLKLKARQNKIKRIFLDKFSYIQDLIKEESEDYQHHYLNYSQILRKTFQADFKQYYITEWDIKFVMSGPDARHLDGYLTLSPKKVRKLIKSFRNALAKMQILKNTEFDGIYSKYITSTHPLLEVIASNKHISLRFWINSKNWKYFRELNINDVIKIISELELVEGKAIKLMNALENLSFK